MSTALFAAGCFWGVEAWFENVKGVTATRVGYAGGIIENPSYEVVKTGQTGHAETVKVEFNPNVISYEQLVDAFFECHDPTSRNRQGEDIGSQYRSIIFYNDDSQHKAAISKVLEWNQKGVFKNPIATEVRETINFYEAEEYHQKYLQKNKTVSCGIV
ncbi:peptide-methionine (S)-S-oxide reductase MsrA [Thalassobacillus pellis]|uniref:peptide-methionine (S)-S-oxide reductase MsrA n=1 Tax=Thalassobacillus pellis TaxID=748008 RepID=UPI001961EA18|nr:peptide-methionine (S)-S-oxide reductase MsrA [Thalassobacillus pellis]MBM7553648.1 peptide-methionine (S)-S-oxide reductase [Thalassobacillus pellis]